MNRVSDTAQPAGGRDRWPLPRDRTRLGLWAAALLLFAALAALAWHYAGTFVLGLFAYYVTRPVFDRVAERFASRTLAVVVTLLVVTLPVLLLTAWILALGIQQLLVLVQTPLFEHFATLLEPYIDVSNMASDLLAQVVTFVTNPSAVGGLDVLTVFVAVAAASLGALFNVGVHTFVAVVLVFYLLRDDYRLVEWARTTLIPPGEILDTYLRAVDTDLQRVYFGNILNAVFTGLLAVVTFSVLELVAPPVVQIPRPELFGILTGVASLVPVVGIKLVWVPLALYLLARALLYAPQTIWFVAVFAVVAIFVVDWIPDQLLRPYVSGRGLHVGAVMLAYTLGPLLFGWSGIFLGPFLLVVVVEFGRIVVPWLVSPTSPLDALAPADRVDATDAGESTMRILTLDDFATTTDGGESERTDGGESVRGDRRNR